MNFVKEAYKKIYSIIPNKVNLSAEEFETWCLDMRSVENIDKLLLLLAKCKENIRMLDLITELNLIHQLSLLYTPEQIGYEVEYTLNKKTYYPDISIKFNDKNIYIQVKRMRKSFDYEKNYIDDGLFVAVYDEEQIRNAMKKACEKCLVKNKDVLLVAQEFSENADVDVCTISNALYGDEQFIFNNRSSYWQRNNNGFYEEEQAMDLCGYIKLTDDTSRILKHYTFDLYPNYKYEGSIDIISSLFPIRNVYTQDMLP